MTKNAAEVFLSGEHSRRRGYLINAINKWNGFAVMGTIAIWALLVKWDVLNGQNTDYELFAIQIGWAGAVSSIFLGIWRLYVRYVDGSITRLYPAIYWCELTLNIPKELSSIRPPKCIELLWGEKSIEELGWKKSTIGTFLNEAITLLIS